MKMTHQKVSGLSGNEIFCLQQKGFKPGQLCVGNSVVAIGVGRGLGAGLSTLGGGEVKEVTDLVHEGRVNALQRMYAEGKQYGGLGIVGIEFDMINHGGNLEFVTVGSTVHRANNTTDVPEHIAFSTSADAQSFYCQLDAGFIPKQFVFGNVAYSIGLGGNLKAYFTRMARGEVAEYTRIFDVTRHLALNRMVSEAKSHGANVVLGVKTTISPLMGTQEMMMVGTAATHPLMDAYNNRPATSDMTNEETWNMVNLGYLPISLVMGVSVYSLGFAGGILASLKSLAGGEVAGLTEILYEAREKALARIEINAEQCGADEVVGVKTRVYDLGGGLVEFMAIGTAVKKIEGVTTRSPQLITQAIIQDQNTFVDSTDNAGRGRVTDIGRGDKASALKTQKGPVTIVLTIIIVIFYIIRIFLIH
jgi:uncharacterized protein YbjQ (UPF0145 family)